jgi:NADH:ubiquinone oxidoreductase subunit 6 (subunit J)
MMIDTKSIAKRMVAKQVIMQPMLWLSLLASILWVCYMTDFSNTFFNIDESNLFNDIKNYSPELYNYITSNNQLANTMPESNVNIIAQTLFNGFGRYILYAGILLLVALIGSISLTIDLKPVRVKQERNTIRSMLSGIKLFR